VHKTYVRLGLALFFNYLTMQNKNKVIAVVCSAALIGTSLVHAQ